MVQVELVPMDFPAEKEKALRTRARSHEVTAKLTNFGTKKGDSIWLSLFFHCSVSIVLRTKLPSHDPNAFWFVRLPSRDAKSMLNVAPFLKTTVIRSLKTRDLC